LQVCAVDFKCLSELVLHEKNGLVFKTEADLTAGLGMQPVAAPRGTGGEALIVNQTARGLQTGSEACRS